MVYPAGPAHNVVSPTSTILDAFYLFYFFTAQVWDLLVSQTNANTYGARIIPDKWIDTCEEEIKAYLGFLVIMGLCKLPRLAMYWSTKHEDLAAVAVKRVMPRDRFYQLCRCFYVNAIEPSLVTCLSNYDRLYEVRKLRLVYSYSIERRFVSCFLSGSC